MKKALILAGGISSRLQTKKPKQFLTVRGKMLIEYTIEACQRNVTQENIFIVCHEDWVSYLKKRIPGKYNIIPGGKTRIASTLIGLRAIRAIETDYIFVLESNRPLIKSSWLKNMYEHLVKKPQAYAGMYTQPIHESIFEHDKNNFISVPKKQFFVGQTPYLFTGEATLEILNKADCITDDQLDLLSLLDITRINPLLAEFENIKVTTKKDFKTIKKIL